MSLSAFVASAALAATAQPTHTVELEYRGAMHQVAYRPLLKTRMRTIGMAAGARPSTERCVVSAQVTVERVIGSAGGSHALKSVLPGSRAFSEQLPGSCHGRAGVLPKVLASKADAIDRHLAEVAVADRQSALGAIETAHHFAAN